MSIPGSALTFLSAASGAAAGYEIERSIRLNSSDSAYLSRTPSSAGNRKTWTWAGWVKRSNLGANQAIFTASSGAANVYTLFWFNSSDQISILQDNGSGGVLTETSVAVYRDPGAWLHIVLAIDTTQATGSNRVKIYVNGAEITLTESTLIAQNADTYVNAANGHRIGERSRPGSSALLSAYLADIHFIDGQALDPTDFGEYDDNNVWQPKDPTFTSPNDGTTWSSTSTITHDGAADTSGTTGTFAAMFDGSLSTNFGPLDGTSGRFINIAFPSAISITSSLRVYASFRTGIQWQVNGSNVSTSGVTHPNTGWQTLTGWSAGTISSLRVDVANGNALEIHAIEIDGVVLIDGANKYGTNGFHLDFSDNSTAAALGTDSSGNSNTWTVNNINTSTVSYSSDLVGLYGLTDAGNAFDGNTATRAKDADGVFNTTRNPPYTLEFIPSTPIAFSSQVRVFTGLNPGSPYNGKIYVDTGSGYGSAITPVQSTWQTIVSGSGSLYKIKCTGDQNEANLNAVEIDGVVLVDSETDSLVDSPTNGTQTDTGAGGEVVGNYCTWNPLANSFPSQPASWSTATLSEGNLKWVSPVSDRAGNTGTIAVSSGKFYWELTMDSVSSSGSFILGVAKSNSTYGSTGQIEYTSNNGNIYVEGVLDSTGASFETGDVIGVAYNANDDQITFYKNNTSQGTISLSGFAGYPVSPLILDRSSLGFTVTANFGQRPFAYTAPSGYKSLCTANLDDPTIADSSTAMDVALWSGDNTEDRLISTANSPGLIWVKQRNDIRAHILQDAVRGFTEGLSSDSTTAEVTRNPPYAESATGGFEVSSSAGSNVSGRTYVGWTWDAGADSSKTYTVKVVSDGGNKFRFDDFGTSAVTLDLEEGSTYVFDQSDSSNATHPLRFATAADAAGGTEYTTGVTTTGTPGQAGAKTTITVASGAPTLYYYCSSHTGMGGQANTNSTAGASNFAGSIQSTVRANASAGFSIVSYTGNGTVGATVGHGLNAAPELVISKNRDVTGSWNVIAPEVLGAGYWMPLHGTDAASLFNSAWTTSSSVITLADGNGHNANGDNIIAYCFASVAGYSAFGSYTGNGSADGPFVYTGFRPAFVIQKRTDSTGNWRIRDTKRGTYNAIEDVLYADTSASTVTEDPYDFLSNGFKIRTSGPHNNASGGSYIYIAFAENPFKTARAR